MLYPEQQVPASETVGTLDLKREAWAVPIACVGEGTALCYAKGDSAATGRESSRETVGSGESVKLTGR